MANVSDIYGDRNIYLELDTSGAVSSEDFSLFIELDIFETDKDVPVLGVLNNESPLKWDKNFLVSQYSENFRYGTFTEGLDVLQRTGTLLTDWQSGTVEGIEFIECNSDWEPIFYTGSYSSSSDIRTLYSDFSTSENIESVEASGTVFAFSPTHTPIKESIRVRKFKISPSLLYETAFEYSSVSEITDSYQKQFLFNSEDNVLYLNDNPITDHGRSVLPETYELISTNAIRLGVGNGSTKDFYLEYFPVVSDDIKAYVLYEDETIERWKFVSEFSYYEKDATVLYLNKDLGIISCGGKEFDSLVLSAAVDEDDTEIVFYITEDIASYPTKGIVNIGSEKIAYIDRSHNMFIGCIRGYSGTTAEIHSLGDVISIERQGFPIPEEGTLYVTYQSTARIDYETTSHNKRTAPIDLKPSSNVDANKIIQIAPRLIDLDSLYLYSEAPILGNDRYGPVYYGNDIARCIVLASDSYGNPVSDLNITLEILDPIIGTLDGEVSEVTKLSDYNGKIYAYYNSPVEVDSYSQKYSEVVYSGSNTQFTFENLDEDSELTDIFVFQIFKQDPVFGTNGIKYDILSNGVDSTHTGATYYFEFENNIEDTFLNGALYIVSSTGILYTREIKYIYGNKIWISEDVPDISYSYAFIARPEDILWDPESLNGVSVILYSWNTEALHPISLSPGAYAPIFPLSLSGETITYEETFPQSYPENPNENLGGYIIIAPRTVSLRAKATDPYSGNLVYSNTIEFKLTLPSYLTGVSYSDGLPIPMGFNLIVDESNATTGTGLGGANFITINKSGGLFGIQLKFSN